MIDIKKELKGFVETLKDDTTMAYVGMATKIEGQFRNCFAAYLNVKYGKKLPTAIEYKTRIDLALLDAKGNLSAAVEFKACISADLEPGPKKRERYIKKAACDIDNRQNAGIKTFAVLLAVNPYCLPEPGSVDSRLVKYYTSMKKFLKTCPSPGTYYQCSLQGIRRDSKDRGLTLVDSGSQMLGTVFGCNIELLYYVLKRSEPRERSVR
jgi:hypothetical protein